MRIGVIAAPLLLIATAVAADSTTVPARADRSVSMTSERLVSKIHAINQMEIRAGNLAMRNGTTPEIRRYGNLLARDHRMADIKLLRLADRRSIQVVIVPTDPKDRTMMARLERSTGKAFDRELLHDMQAGHRQAISLLESVRDRSRDAELTGLVARLLPILRQHEDLAGTLGRQG